MICCNNETENISYCYAIFHLNLAFSSINSCQHRSIITKCYWPLLNIIDHSDIPLGIELTAFTLERIRDLDFAWVEKFKTLLNEGRCELIASGDSQLIGPLLPAKINEFNLRIGHQAYADILGINPNIAYINEQAASSGLLDIYLELGYKAVVLEWDNPFSHNKDWPKASLNMPQLLRTASGKDIPVIWNHAIAFQKLQRYAHAELSFKGYADYLKKSHEQGITCFPIYGNDAEIFDFRPGRFSTETETTQGEWEKITEAFSEIENSAIFKWILPSAALKHLSKAKPLQLSSMAQPIIVKKQAKYNITRWALSGKNDLALNTHCYKVYKQLLNEADTRQNDWRALCRLWASDLRTHLTEDRYKKLQPSFNTEQQKPANYELDISALDCSDIERVGFSVEEDPYTLLLKNDRYALCLNKLRGFSIQSLAFSSQNWEPVIGTLAHGHFDHISYAADFYSNHLVMERFTERDRVTDLGRGELKIAYSENSPRLLIDIPTKHGNLRKSYTLLDDEISCHFEFDHQTRPVASLRLGYLTLSDCSEASWAACHNGGKTLEIFDFEQDYDHGAPVSSIVSASCAYGASGNTFYFGSGNKGLKLSWAPELCAAIPMSSGKKIGQQFLNRCWFSLIEADETLRAGGLLPSFGFTLTACKKPVSVSA